jgi:uncharacterized glyoxalase superfamily protein PhnB
MNRHALDTRVTVIPSLRYRDAQAAIEWLCRAFGFEKQVVYEGPGGIVEHAQLTFGNGMIMLGTAGNDPYGRLVQPPAGPDSATTHGIYLVVADADAHHAMASAAGARIVTPPHDEDYGGRHYACRDAEGYLWNFGSYDPWTEPSG